MSVIRRYLVGATLARTGDELSGPALLLLGMTAGPHAGAALLAGLTAAAAVGGPVFGALLDRSATPGRLLAVALGGYASGIALVIALFGRLPLAAVVAVAVVTGLLNPAVAGGWTAQLPAVAGAALPKASRLDA
ncbi:MFS transporter, partial [Amycolatopsis mediterranei]